MFIALCCVYFFAGYVLGFYQGTVSSYNDRIYQINTLFEDTND